MGSMNEEWRPVTGYEGYYEVSSVGNVRRVKRGLGARVGQNRALRVTKKGHLEVSLSKDRTRRTFFVHRLVAVAFLGDPEDGLQVCHWDDNPSNNNVDNLRWGTASDNMSDRLRNGKHPGATQTHCKRGHEFTSDNTRIHNGARHCIACKNSYRRRAHGGGHDS